MEIYGGSGGIVPPFLISALGGGKWSVSRPGHFTPRKITAGTHWIEVWLGLRSGLDAVEKRKKILPCPELMYDRQERSM
jgi:hypothetical protein